MSTVESFGVALFIIIFVFFVLICLCFFIKSFSYIIKKVEEKIKNTDE